MTTVVGTLQAGTPPAGDPARPPRRLSRTAIWVIGGLIFLQLAAGVAAAASVAVPYYAILPGQASPTNDLIELPDDRKVDAPTGRVLFVTVGLRPLHGLEYLLAKRDEDVQVVPERLILGTSTRQEYRKQSSQDMALSKETAAVVALQRLCFDVVEKGTGARILLVVEGSPAESVGILAEDTITEFGGAPIATRDDLLRPLAGMKPGAPFTATVEGPEPGAQPRQVSGKLAPSEDDPARGFLGVRSQTRAQDFDLPFEVGVASGRVGGPSAGLAFTLALLDQLTPGELTGGRTVAATGTIELDSRVGPVGGVPQKAVAVRRSKAALFLVPSQELAEARRKVGPSVLVLPVDTLEQAIAALRDNGGDTSGIPLTCPGS